MHAKTATIVRQTASNTLKTGLLLAAIVTLAAVVGYVLVGGFGLLFGIVTVVILAAVGLQVPAHVLMRWHGGVPISRLQAPALHRLVEQLAARADIPTPSLWLIARDDANAMATSSGDGRSSLAITQGAIDLLEQHELEGVLAHEIAHIQHGDTTLLRITGLVTQAVSVLLRLSIWVALLSILLTGTGVERALLLLFLAILVPVSMTLIQTALSRTREFVADLTAARLTGKPWALASALRKIENRFNWFGTIVRPAVPSLLQTHPSTDERIRRLRSMAALPMTQPLHRPLTGLPKIQHPDELFGWLYRTPANGQLRWRINAPAVTIRLATIRWF